MVAKKNAKTTPSRAALEIREWPDAGGFEWVLKIEATEAARSRLHYCTREEAQAAFSEFARQAASAEVL